MKKLISLLLILLLSAGLTACSHDSADTGTEPEKVHNIGVIVYNLGSEEVIGVREYLQGYIENNFEMVKFLYSDSIRDLEGELSFIKDACENGAEGFLSFTTHDLQKEVELCSEYGAYYMLASGTVSEEDFDSVADNPYFLGAFGPGNDEEYRIGADMARYFVNSGIGDRYFILSGGSPLGNEMHYLRTLGILEALCSAYSVELSDDLNALAHSADPVTVSDGALTVTVCPGYVDYEQYLVPAVESYEKAEYDCIMSVLPPSDMAERFGGVHAGVIDSYNTRNLQLFVDGSIEYVVGKYSSIVGPSFALMLNAVTGYAKEFRADGKAVKAVQCFWVSESMDDYTPKYALSVSAGMNAYNFDDLSNVCRLFNPDASLSQLLELASACGYDDVMARRS